MRTTYLPKTPPHAWSVEDNPPDATTHCNDHHGEATLLQQEILVPSRRRESELVGIDGPAS